MLRLILVLGLLFLTAFTSSAERPRPLGWAIEAARNGSWDNAARIAARDGAVAEDIIEWMRLRAGLGRYEEIMAFLERRPDWPGETYLRRQSEGTIARQTHSAILDFFAETPPQTPRGVLMHAEALAASGRSGDAQVNIVLAWRNRQMTVTDQALYLDLHGGLLETHHSSRLESMLWRGSGADARRMFDLVSEDEKKLAEAWLALLNLSGDVTSRLEAVPEALRDHPGLAHARFEWRIRKGFRDEAKAILLDQSRRAEKLGRPESWSNRRRALARDEMRDGDPAIAYQLAARHFLTEGSDFADLEWLSGYIALRYLNLPQIAIEHFKNHQEVVRSVISRARAGYWLGRAYEAMEDAENAADAYRSAGRYQTAFYGILAAEHAGIEADTNLNGGEDFGDWRSSDLAQRDLFQAGLLLAASGEANLAERFWAHLVEDLDRQEAGLLGRAVLDVGTPHMAVMVGKRAARQGVEIHAPYYPLHPLARRELPIAPEMSLAIARRESEFDPGVQSGVGARGLMQIMPATGRSVARKLGVTDHTTERLMTDPEYNARLGSSYLSELAGIFDGNVVMMSAGYNAGPSRPLNWMQKFGDPRATPEIDIVDWIEHIPFRETRNYVMRVTESLPIYRARLGKPALPIPFSEELVGSTLLSFAPERE